MKERMPLVVKLAAAALPALALVGCSGGGGKDKNVATPTLVGQTPGRDISATATSGSRPTETRTVLLTSTAVATATATKEPSPTATPTLNANSEANYSVKFGEGLNNWVEVANAGDLQGLSEFTILARVKADGIPPDAVVAKGEDVEAYALFISLPFSCHNGDMALVVNNKAVCSGIVAPRGKFVDIAVTFKDHKVRFYVDDAVSLEVALDENVPVEFGRLFIGASPRGLNEGFSGQMDHLEIINRGLTPSEVSQSFAMLGGGDVNRFIAANSGVIAMWTFDRGADLKDVSGNGHEGAANGKVSLIPTN